MDLANNIELFSTCPDAQLDRRFRENRDSW